MRTPMAGVIGAALAAAALVEADIYSPRGFAAGSGSRGQKVRQPANPDKKAKRKAQAKARAITKRSGR